MTPVAFIRILRNNFLLIAGVAITMGVLVYFLTLNQEQTYRTKALVYTGIASGYDIEAMEDQRIDYFGVNNAFDNLINIVQSQYTKEETALRLLALHLQYDEPSPGILGPIPFQQLKEVLPTRFREKHLVAGSPELTLVRLRETLKGGSPFLNELLYKSKSPYGLKTIGNCRAVRKGSSDMVEFIYEYSNAEICHTTLEILLDVFIERYRKLKEAETSDVVAYFEKRLSNAKEVLNTAENNLTKFRSSNQIINYNEQTKFIASKKQDALERYTQERMDLVASQAVMDSLEARLNQKDVILNTNTAMMNKRDQLAEIRQRIAFLEIEDRKDQVVDSLEIEAEKLRDQISDHLKANYDLTHSNEGVQIQELLRSWLDNLVKVSEQKARIQLYEDRLSDINKQYDIYAPLGSTLSRLEREIDVAERAYLEVLHGLNMAKLREQNIQMSNNLNVIDPPEFPLEPEPSKRMLLVILAFLVGGVGTLSLILAIHLLDRTLGNPEKAEKDSGLHVIGALPVLKKNMDRKYPGLISLLMHNFYSRLELAMEDELPHRVAFYSHYDGEGRSIVLKQLQEEYGEEVKIIVVEEHQPEQSHQRSAGDHKYEFFEFPAILKTGYMMEMMKSCSQHVLIARADRAWDTPDRRMLSDFRDYCDHEPLLFLNGVKIHALDQLIGELPTKRSKLRIWIKRLVRFEFSKNQFTL